MLRVLGFGFTAILVAPSARLMEVAGPSYLRVEVLGLKVKGFGFKVQGLVFRGEGSGFWFWGLGFSVYGSGFRVWGLNLVLGCRVYRADLADHLHDLVLCEVDRLPRHFLPMYVTIPRYRLLSGRAGCGKGSWRRSFMKKDRSNQQSQLGNLKGWSETMGALSMWTAGWGNTLVASSPNTPFPDRRLERRPPSALQFSAAFVSCFS